MNSRMKILIMRCVIGLIGLFSLIIGLKIGYVGIFRELQLWEHCLLISQGIGMVALGPYIILTAIFTKEL
jgi:hypothetical protein